ncbi:hypothetical protein V8E36_007310 [Tilletia maclaganii]
MSCVCIQCGCPQDHLYLRYPHGGSVRSAPCQASCGQQIGTDRHAPAQSPQNVVAQRKRPADPYIESDGIIVFLDLVLVKPRAFRHLLFNRPLLDYERSRPAHLHKDADQGSEVVALLPRVRISTGQAWIRTIRTFAAVQLVDAFLQWYHLCSYGTASTRQLVLLPHPLLQAWWPTAFQESRSVLSSYILILAAVTFESIALHATVTLILSAYTTARKQFHKRPSSSADKAHGTTLFRPHMAVNALVLANVSTCFLLSLILLWESRYRLHRTDNASLSTSNPSRPETHNILEYLADRLRSFQPDAVIRHLVASLSSGVALAVVLPRTPIVTTGSILAGWAVAAHVRSTYTLLPGSSGEDTARSFEGVQAAPYFCPSWT